MTILPIFTRELGSDRSVGRLRRDRIVAGAVAGAVFIAAATAERWSDGFNLTRTLKGIPVAGIVPWLLLAVGLSRGSRLLALERREGTLPLLLLTRLTGRDILLGKLLHALLVELNSFLGTVPAMILPLLVAGFGWKEIGLISLGCANVVFFGQALGLFWAVFFDTTKAESWSLLLILPFLGLATPFGILLPTGSIREALSILQLFNPGEALAHVQTMLGGFRPGAFWAPWLISHLTGWGFLLTGGLFLARACQHQAGQDAGPRAKRDRAPRGFALRRSVVFRTHLLNRNPFLWLTSRSPWPTIQAWLYLVLMALLWGWLAWLTAVVRGTNVAVVMVIALAVSWMTLFVVVIPAEASRRLAEDRQSGALEMLLCTPLSVERIVEGQWLALGRRYLPPIIVSLILSLGLMLAGYVTYGFGGMLEPEDRPLWVFGWLAGMGLLPLSLVALGWVSMRRALAARNVGDAGGIAVLQVIGLPCLALPVGSMLLHALLGWNPESWWKDGLFVAGVALTQAGFAWRARLGLLRGLRQAAADRYAPQVLDGRARRFAGLF